MVSLDEWALLPLLVRDPPSRSSVQPFDRVLMPFLHCVVVRQALGLRVSSFSLKPNLPTVLLRLLQSCARLQQLSDSGVGAGKGRRFGPNCRFGLLGCSHREEELEEERQPTKSSRTVLWV